MKKFAKQFLALLLAMTMALGLLSSTAWATNVVDEPTGTQTAPADEQETAPADEAEEQTEAEEPTEDEPAADEESTTQPQTAAQEPDTAVTVTADHIQLPEIQFEGANAVVAAALVKESGIEIDETDPAIIAARQELENMKVTVESDSPSTFEGETEKTPLTEEQIQTVLGMYALYQQQWAENADVLGVQMPFYLQYNDKEDGLGALGEMLVLAGVTVDKVRSGEYSYDDLTGMILNFHYGDKLGVEYYGSTLRSRRDEALKAVKDSGAKTEYQKLLVLNDWLATVDSFDMSYIMNQGKDEPSMAAQNPQKHAHYDDIYNTMYAVYQEQYTTYFHDQIFAGIEAQLRQQYYENAIKNLVYQNTLAQIAADPENPTADEKAQANTAAEQYMTDNADAISKDAAGFVAEKFGEEAATKIAAGADDFIATAETEGVEVDPENAPGVKMTVEELTQQSMENDLIDLDGDGTKDMTANKAIPYIADQAATAMTPGILGYWEGNQVGALAEGKSVCLGYTKAYAYLVQCMHPEIYTNNGNYEDASDWKAAKDLYYDENENLSIDKDYAVDVVRISFETDVTMYGETQPGFNSDHFWNAVKVGGQWYYVDPCYNDVYTEVMIRDRVETAGYMNHLYFMFSHDTTTSLYDGYYSELKTLYADAANDKTYEKAWFARAKSNVYSDGSNFYYVYDSTDTVSMLDSFNDMNQGGSIEDMEDLMGGNTRYKLVKRAISDTDSGDGDTDYETLIEFNYDENEDDDDYTTVARVYNPESKEMVENELLTKLFAQHEEQAEIYPSISITTALSGGKLYFNLSNVLLSYDLSSGEVAVVKQYDTVYAQRDLTNAFSGMAFSFTESATSNDSFSFEDHPIAGICLDGSKLDVSIATNLAYISGKDDGSRSTDPDYTADNDSNGYGYEFEETNYNPNYNSYFGDNSEETNDNDEFMWVANLAGSVSIDSLSAVEYDKVDDLLINCDHHYIKFDETYFTKTNSTWNTGFCYVCTKCGKALEEPVDQSENSSFGSQMTEEEKEKLHQQYLEEKAEYDAVVASAGHTYAPTDADWKNDEEGNSTVTFQNLKLACHCPEVHDQLDCLVNETFIEEVALTEAVTATTEKSYSGNCAEGITTIETASGKTDKTEDGSSVNYVATKETKGEAGQHKYEGEFVWTAVEDNPETEEVESGYTATVASLKCSVCGDEVTNPTVKVTSETKDATCEEAGAIVYTATAYAEDGTTALATDTKTEETSPALGHSYGEPIFDWADDYSTCKATFTCATCEKVETVDCNVTASDSTATCTEAGRTTYTATCTFLDQEYTDKQIVDVPATGHRYGEPGFTWTRSEESGYTCTATFTCSACEDTKIEPCTVTPGETVEPTCGADGKHVYVAKVTFEGTEYTGTKDEAIPATGDHQYGDDGFCTVCNTEQRLATPVLSSVSNGLDGVQVTWKAVPGAENYRVFRKTSSSGWKRVGDTSATSLTDKTAKSGTTYTYTVRCISRDGSNYISAYNTTGKTTKYLSKVTLSTPTNASSGITVKWSKVTGASGYKVYRQAGSSTKWSTVATIKSGSTVSWTDTKTSSGTKYTYSVRAYSGKYMSVKGSTNGLTKTMYRLSRPSITYLKNTGSRKFTVKWKKVSGATGYQVSYRIGSAASKRVTVKGSSTVSKSITCLSKGKTYKVYVRAYKTVGGKNYYSAWSSYKTVKISR